MPTKCLCIFNTLPQIESLNKQTYANNANITEICQNSTVCKNARVSIRIQLQTL